MRIERDLEGNAVFLIWKHGVLESAPMVEGPWSEILKVGSPLRLEIELEGQQFFRVRGE